MLLIFYFGGRSIVSPLKLFQYICFVSCYFSKTLLYWTKKLWLGICLIVFEYEYIFFYSAWIVLSVGNNHHIFLENVVGIWNDTWCIGFRINMKWHLMTLMSMEIWSGTWWHWFLCIMWSGTWWHWCPWKYEVASDDIDFPRKYEVASGDIDFRIYMQWHLMTFISLQ